MKWYPIGWVPKRKRRIILTNDKHNTSIILMVYPNEPLTYKQVKRCREQLCGIPGCECNKDLGTHGDQAYDISYNRGEGFKISPRQYSLFKEETYESDDKRF